MPWIVAASSYPFSLMQQLPMLTEFRSSRHSGCTPKAGGPETGKSRSTKGWRPPSPLVRSSEPLGANIWKEFENIGEDETIYKLVGPVLLKQETFEAESTVKGRLDFIGGEMLVPIPYTYELSDYKSKANPSSLRRTRLEGQIKETQENIEKKKTEIIQLQAGAQGAIGGQ